MTLYRVEDTASIDAFTLPSLFDARARFYQEWHDFVFFDRKTGIFGLLNFGVHGNPYDSKRGWGSVLSYIVDPSRKIFAELKLIPMNQLEVTSYNPNFVSDNFSVELLADNSFDVVGKMEHTSFNLNLKVVSPPVTDKDIFMEVLKEQNPNSKMLLAAQEMNRQWESWVELPRLFVEGNLKVNKKHYAIKTNQGYQDHEGGCFDIGMTWGWDTGVIFCDPSVAIEPGRVDFLIYRYGATNDLSYGGVFLETKDGKRQFFDSAKMKITASGDYEGNRSIMPAITQLLYPDYRPTIPKTRTFTASKGADKLEVVFTPKAVCSIVNTSVVNSSEVVFNEMYCEASLMGKVGGSTYDCVLPCWFESVRPRKRDESNAIDT
jgi:hypothetical protein